MASPLKIPRLALADVADKSARPDEGVNDHALFIVSAAAQKEVSDNAHDKIVRLSIHNPFEAISIFLKSVS